MLLATMLFRMMTDPIPTRHKDHRRRTMPTRIHAIMTRATDHVHPLPRADQRVRSLLDRPRTVAVEPGRRGIRIQGPVERDALPVLRGDLLKRSQTRRLHRGDHPVLRMSDVQRELHPRGHRVRRRVRRRRDHPRRRQRAVSPRDLVRGRDHLRRGEDGVAPRAERRGPRVGVAPVDGERQPPVPLGALHDAQRAAGLQQDRALLDVQFEVGAERHAGRRAGRVAEIAVALQLRAQRHGRVVDVAQIPGRGDGDGAGPDARRAHGFGEAGAFLAVGR